MVGGTFVETRVLKSQENTKNCHPTNRTVGITVEVTDQIRLLFENLLKDFCSRCVRYSLTDYTRDIDTLKKRIDAEGIGFAAKILPTLAKNMFQFLETGEAAYPGYKLQPGTKYPRFLKGIFYVVYGPFATEEKAYAIDCIYQLSSLFKKIEGDYPEKILAEKYDEFKAVDLELASKFDNLDESSFETLELARALFNEDWKEFDVFGPDSIPRPGPGATRSKTPKHMRYEPHMFFSMHQQSFPYEEWFYPDMWSVVGEARSFLGLINNPELGFPKARMMYVAKYYGTPRGICIEENESQWLQQGCANGMRSHVKRHPTLAGHVEFNDQSINRALALQASIDMEDATIDMEGGSDRHPRDVVSWVTQDNVDFHNALMCLSTRCIEPPVGDKKQILFLNKFAPMGSGLCFPVMGLMHYYLILAIVKRAHDADIKNRLYVYGDDIVLPTRYTDSVFDELPKYGMKLNRNKSFAHSNFRESCGIHAYGGVDITPVFVRRTLRPGKIDTMVSAFATEELLYNKGLYHTAKCVRDLYEKTNGHVPFITSTSPLVGWKRPACVLTELTQSFDVTRSRRRPRKSKKLDHQCYEYRVLCIIPEYEANETMPETQAYLRWFSQRTENSSSYHGALSQQRLGWRWKTLAECMPDISMVSLKDRKRVFSYRPPRELGFSPRNYLLRLNSLNHKICRAA